MAEKPLHSDHRSRMHKRVAENGFEGFADHEVLEYLLYFALPRVDTNPIAHRLMDRFGSFEQVMEAGEEELLKVKGVGPASARLIKTVMMTGHHYQKSKNKNAKFLNSPEKLIDYCVHLFHALTEERLYAIFMDDSYRLLRTVLIAEGEANAVAVSSRKIVRLALSHNATTVVLTHNHPKGLPIASQADKRTTAAIKTALAMVDITLCDHIIVADGEGASMNESQRMPKEGEFASLQDLFDREESEKK